MTAKPKARSKCKHPELDKRLNCKSCGVLVDIREKKNKYGAQKVFLDGMWFDSTKEARRWTDLRHDPEVKHLVRQVEYELVVEAILICSYRADFVYMRRGEKVVEDAKPKGKTFKKTAAYKIFQLKKRLMLACHGIEVVEI